MTKFLVTLDIPSRKLPDTLFFEKNSHRRSNKKVAAKVWRKIKEELDGMGGDWDYFIEDLAREGEEKLFYKRMREIIERVLNDESMGDVR